MPHVAPTADTARRILWVDADAYFVSVYALLHPEEAASNPFIIVGGTREGRGVVTSASYPARARGVRAGMPVAHAARLCPEALCVPVPMAACREYSTRIIAVLTQLAPTVESCSIDEAVCDFTGTDALPGYGDFATLAARVRDAIYRETRLRVTCGGGSSKVIAKLAIERAKPAPSGNGTGVYIVPPGAENAFMRTFQLRDISFVGPEFDRRLARWGLRSVEDALRLSVEELVTRLGPRDGRWLYERIRGIDPTPVAPRTTAKSLSREETFPRDLFLDADLRVELQRCATAVAHDLRQDGLQAKTVTVRLRDSDFTTRQASQTLAEPVHSDRAILAAALPLLHRLRAQRREAARLIGVSVSGLLPTREGIQLGLFEASSAPTPPSAGGTTPSPDTRDGARDRALSAALDAIRHRHGKAAILPASLLSRPGVTGGRRDPGTGGTSP